jgi:uncharacterized membrane protein
MSENPDETDLAVVPVAPVQSPQVGQAAPGFARRLVGIFAGLLLVVYPLVVYLALTRLGARATAALVLLALLLWGLRARLLVKQGFRTLLVQVGGIAVLSILTLASGYPAFLQQMPVLVSVFLLVTFLSSLVRPPPMVERYARLVTPDLSDAEVRHCLVVTWAWVLFLVANAATAEALVIWGTPEQWAIFAGGISYGLMGLMFAVEYVVRKARFGRFGNGPLDRVLAELLRGDSQGNP